MQIEQFVFGVAGLLALVAFMPVLAGRLRLPYSVLLAIIGFALGVTLHLHQWAPKVLGDFLNTLQAFQISSETFLYLFLPILLFETSLSMNLRRLLDDVGAILMMAVVAVVVCTFAVGFALNEASHYGLLVCLLLGAIVATTDPIAVVGVFREVGAPKRLSTLVEGEALFNDAASIALYTVLLAVLTQGGHLSGSLVLQTFLVSFLGGGLAGYFFGVLANQLFIVLRGWPAAEVTLTIALAYLSYFVSEHYLQVSGVVATVIAGLVVGSNGRTRMSPVTFELLRSSWTQMGFLANSLIFLFAAMLIPRLMADISWKQVFLIVLLFAVTLLARAVMVFGVLPLLGRTRFGNKVSAPYCTVILWGGLRGAVSLALALAVTEQQALPYEMRQFIGVAATGFVLMTLFINGMTLRPLIRALKLDRLSPVESSIRDQAVVLALDDLQERIQGFAHSENIPDSITKRVSNVFDSARSSVALPHIQALTLEQKINIGMGMLISHEIEKYYEQLSAQVVDWKSAETLLARAESLADAVRGGGIAGYEAAIARDMRYSYRFRVALRLHYLFGFQAWLAFELGQRFSNLMVKSVITRRLTAFIHTELKPLLGDEASDRILEIHNLRVKQLEVSLHALSLQYPAFSHWLQERYLARIVAAQERSRYRSMLSQALISSELYVELVRECDARWSYVSKRPDVDFIMSAADLIQRVPMLQGVKPETLKHLLKKMRPRLTLPGQQVHLRQGSTHNMYFIASGALSVDLPDGTQIELGTGNTVGELTMLSGVDLEGTVRSLSYSRLLMLHGKDFESLMEQDPLLKEKMQAVAAQRKRAYEVWREYQQGKFEPTTDKPVFQVATALSAASEFVGPMSPTDPVLPRSTDMPH
ncbi:cation:proton antiporter [Alcaligenes endophyticus]|uniref:Cation:proton antiporter n=1 Tax=Alcaligenes endophyticus TaxID=1929088 RepID=A0ABT8EFE2_9BURK|nr:cation:proton antiporter [Alcaligenes endophyticus]MCX5590336.1 cation:proton antiporter [Alcaligenes endophyticus]MDN4120000.1 cation:proton antiporter [Alcaligenes endophyticus]